MCKAIDEMRLEAWAEGWGSVYDEDYFGADRGTMSGALYMMNKNRNRIGEADFLQMTWWGSCDDIPRFTRAWFEVKRASNLSHRLRLGLDRHRVRDTLREAMGKRR